MSSSPKKRKLPPRPKITLPVPGQYPGHYPQTMGYVQTPYGQTPVPLTPVSGQPTIVFPSKSHGFVFEHLKGFKDWTKSGLSVGEKSAFWLYEKVSSWSKRWFTHIFLFFVLFLYSVLGAFLFHYIEGENENIVQEDIKKERDEMIQQIRDLWNDKELMEDSEKWKGHAKNHLMLYEEKLYQFLKKLNFQTSRPDNVNWAFWNAVIYCSTIYTTIVSAADEPTSMDEEEEQRRLRMEQMVEDTERLEQDRARSRSQQREEPPPPATTTKARDRSPAVNRPEAASRDEDAVKPPPPKKPEESPPRKKPEAPPPTKKPEEPPPPRKKPEDSPPKSREQPEEIERPPPPPQPPVKASRKPRESSDGTELRRRMGSPEAAKTRSGRRLSPPPAVPRDEEPEPRPAKKRPSSRHRYQNPSDEDEPPAPVQHHRSRRSPSQPLKKQIIALSQESLIDDVARAKRAYSRRDRGYDDYEYEYEDEAEEEEEEEYVPRRRKETTVRKRKASIVHTDQERDEISKSCGQTSSWFSWIPFFGRRQKVDEMIEETDKDKQKEKEKKEKEAAAKAKLEKSPSTAKEPESDKVTFREIFSSIREINSEFREFCRQNPQEVRILIELRNLCIVETIISVIVCGLGGFAFRFTEGAFESFYKCGVKRVKRDFLDSLWTYSHNMKEDDWKSMARRKLMDFEEQLHAAHEAGVQTYSGQRSWSFLNAMVYCLTVISTIGYGHISPSTTTGRALTIIYAIIGIPMFLIVLADFGKLFTRGIKFLWAFVRRLYYTGSCRKVRRTAPMQEMMKGVQLVYDLATFRRPSQMSPEELAEMQRQQQTVLSLDANTPQQPDSPSTPAMSAFEIDDEFNLPISVAITILVLYIFIGATVFNIIEDWTFFESFYFVFISMSTIGFGDFVPKEPLYMMLSIVYLIFGLALTSMCINVVQVMLADSFKQASQKIGASIGFHVSDEDGSLKPAPPDPVEIAEVHNATSSPEEKEKVAPKAKQEDVEL